MIDNTIAAARAAGGARVVLPGTIYNYDPMCTPAIGSATPQTSTGAKGRVRIALERRLEAAAPEVPALILRAGDFFGPGMRSSWFGQAMITPGKPVKKIVNPACGPGHAWAYLPDFAEAVARLLDAQDRLQPFERLQFGGIYDNDGQAMTGGIRRVVGRKLPVLRFPWGMMRLLAPVAAFPREAVEIAPYWRHPIRLDNSRLEALIGPEPRRALDEALRATRIDMGCLGRVDRAA